MPTEPELRREIADERRELTNAVADLRKEIDHTAERGKRIGIAVGGVTAAVITIRTALRIRRSLSDD